MKINPMFVKALMVDLVLIGIALYLVDMFTGAGMFESYLLPILAVYAVLHIIAEASGIG